MIRHIFHIILFCTLLVSCEYFKPKMEENVVARVNDNFLYEKDIQKLISEDTTPEDSILIVNNYINRWATQQLLIDQARINLSADQLEQYEKLVQEYQNDLLTEAYKNVIVSKQLDSTITEQEYRDYYETNKENFRLKDLLVKLRYVQLPVNYEGLASVREKLGRYNEKDRKSLNSQDYQFISSNFNDSVWVRKEILLNTLPAIRDNSEQVLKKSNFTQLQDSLGVYLVKIEDVLNPNDTAPLSYVKPTLKQIILNKRKLELIKKLETDITRDAIETNNFEIYKNE
ncbi:MAG: peptidyl-prolyl cis-trans isomerase [Aequorivita sp.]|nr:peptidyl-prolyl cis-trans isomerase [Aequorivita sp.]MAO48661.1 peptidyl-prolyl cis-trans isomerase [Aequorivita sp.]MBF31700.1 peptidyl-prolyl cis-trans isomerase [Aequorivita sp.]HAV53361.1 peptidyl-prolyl cis-trans isomerase [Aequorivita sp.]HBL80952.1 peptidyl-prolyl cis-trans isomerase [Aequorivita sp.]